MLVIERPRLAVGSDVDSSNALPGFVLLLRNTGDNSLDKQRHEHYREYLFLSFAERARAHWDNAVSARLSRIPSTWDAQ